MSLPLRRMVLVRPWTTSMFKGPCTEMASPSMGPTVSWEGWSVRAEGGRKRAAKRTAISVMKGSTRVAATLIEGVSGDKAAASRRTPKKAFCVALAGGNESGSEEFRCGDGTHRDGATLEHYTIRQ